MPTPPLELVVVERFPPSFRAYRWIGSVADAPLPAVAKASSGDVRMGDWILWDQVGHCRIVPNKALRAMYQLPSGEPIP